MSEQVQKVSLEMLSAKVDEYLSKLNDLRRDGSDKVRSLTQEIRRIKIKKNVSKETKANKIAEYQQGIAEAKVVAEKNKAAISQIEAEACAYVNANFAGIYAETKAQSKKMKADAKANYLQRKAEIKQKLAADLQKLANEETDKQKLEARKNVITRESKQSDIDNKKAYLEQVQKAKDLQHNCYLQRDEWLYAIKDGKQSLVTKVSNYCENYAYQFDLKNFLMKNGLYIIIVAFMIVCIVMQPYLISLSSIMLILKNFSTRIFFALGVAGLILLAGTDLSVGRMVTLGTMITCMILNPTTTVTFFGLSFNGIYASLGFGGAVIVAILLSVVMCVLFSALAGFFSAKFKMHPFISTLGTSLIIWGLVGFGTNNIKTGNITSEAMAIGGSIGMFPITLIYAIVAIVIVWFIWNKTKFGKNMYAVGGNPEAASVSGISVFKVTLGVFIMAGVLYGLGGFFQSTVTGSSSSSFGQGWELEAIAACVIGGISFTGGIGKISGAVIGCLIFEVLKYYLRAVFGGSSDISNIFIGVIILAAVTFDSIKYLKKK